MNKIRCFLGLHDMVHHNTRIHAPYSVAVTVIMRCKYCGVRRGTVFRDR